MSEPAANPWRTLSSRVVYRSPWLVLREDRVIRPDGAEGIYGVVEIPFSCGVVAIDGDDQIALVSQWRYVHGKLSLEIPTGGSAEGETPLAAAKRERRGDRSHGGQLDTLGTVDNSNGVTTDVAHMFVARDLKSGAPVPQGDERVELRWMPFADAVRSVLTGGITESVSVAAILKAELLGTARLPCPPRHEPGRSQSGAVVVEAGVHGDLLAGCRGYAPLTQPPGTM